MDWGFLGGFDWLHAALAALAALLAVLARKRKKELDKRIKKESSSRVS